MISFLSDIGRWYLIVIVSTGNNNIKNNNFIYKAFSYDKSI